MYNTINYMSTERNVAYITKSRMKCETFGLGLMCWTERDIRKLFDFDAGLKISK